MIRLIALLLLAGSVSAETITLQPSGCSNTKICYHIPNDSPLDITIYGAQGYPYFSVIMTDENGTATSYLSHQASDGTLVNVSLESYYNPNPLDPRIRVFTGQFITLSGSFTGLSSYCGRYRCMHWQWNGGSIVR